MKNTRRAGGRPIPVLRGRRFLGWALVLMAAFLDVSHPGLAFAVRPFVTDDARVLGAGLLQLETSMRVDKTLAQNLNLFAFGPADRLEITLGWVDGFPREGDSSGVFGIAGPIAQLKYLAWAPRPNGRPGLAFAAGVVPPYGSADLGLPSWVEFAYAAVTQSLFDRERLLIHLNLGGVSVRPEGGERQIKTIWGLGAQLRLWGGLHSVSEIFYGDPYSGRPGGAYQLGFRHFISENVQVDATFGAGLWGDPRLDTFIGAGLRIVFPPLWKK